MRPIILEVKEACEAQDLLFHTWEVDGDICNNEDGWTYYTEFETELSEEDIKTIMAHMRDEGYGSSNCGHSYDCCGCSFLSSWRIFGTVPSFSVFSEKRSKKTRSFIVKETWGRNY